MGENKSARARLSNDELWFFEDNIALCVSIIYDADAIIQITEDDDVLEFAQSALLKADEIRRSLIKRMNERKRRKRPAAATADPTGRPDEAPTRP